MRHRTKAWSLNRACGQIAVAIIAVTVLLVGSASMAVTSAQASAISTTNVQSDPPPAVRCPAGSTCYFFSANGSDSTGAGTEASPWQTVAKAMTKLSSLKPGDRMLFKGGDTWTAQMFTFGDNATHAVQGAHEVPIVIGTYGTGKPILDENNTNPYCFNAVNPANSVQYLTLDNFECIHAFSQAVTFHTAGGLMPGITVQNFLIRDTGPGCATSNAACIGAESPPNWAARTTYSSNSQVDPTSGNVGWYWFAEMVPACTSGGFMPTWPQAPGTAVTDGTCIWKNTGVTGVAGNGYANQLDFEDSGVAADGVHFLNNTVRWGGGHNLVQVHYDTGPVLVKGNIVGPGGNHGFIDVKGIGSTSRQAVIANNVVDGGQSSGLAGSGLTPSFYTENTANPYSNIVWEANVASDTHIALQICPGGVLSGRSAGGSYKIYNNTFYAVTNTSGSLVYLGDSTCAGANAGSLNKYTLDVRNNIFDGGPSDAFTLAVATNGIAYSPCTENYNNIGGSQGNKGYASCGGRTTLADHDQNGVNPLYVNAPAGNLQLQAASPEIGRGLDGLTPGMNNIGAF